MQTIPLRRARGALQAAVMAACSLTFASHLHAEVQARDAERIFSESDDPGTFGIAVAVLDFNGDGQNEIAIADPYEVVEGGGTRGIVRIYRRDSNGQWVPSFQGDLNSSMAQFGLTLATGDFDEDGRDDLLIGAPGHGNGGGAVYLLYHSAPTTISQAGIILNSGASFGRCGSSLAIGDFDNDGSLDFAAGCPLASFDGHDTVGRVQIQYGAPNGIFSGGFISQASPGVGGGPETGDAFGASLAAANFDCSGATDLAIGAPGEDVDGGVSSGAVHVLYGVSASPLSGTGSQLWHQGVADVPGMSGNGDRFGTTLAGGNFTGASLPPCRGLAVGIPDDAESPGGAVLVLRGSASDGLVATDARLITVEDFLPDPFEFPPNPVPDSNHRLGNTLLAANLGRGSATDLIIGLEGYSPFQGPDQPGMACIAYSAEFTGVLGEGHRCFSGSQFGAGPDTDMSFGTGLAAGNLDDASGNELVIGVPFSNRVLVLRNPLFSDGFEGSAD